MKQPQAALSITKTGIYLPASKITSRQIDDTMNYRPGLTEKLTGVQTRYYVDNETASEMAMSALLALQSTHSVSLNDIDCIIAASGTMEQAIPCNAAMLLKLLDLEKPIPAFDVNMTCLGSLMAIDLAATLVNSGQYRNILVYASDIASVGVTWEQPSVGGIFGDGAACILIEKEPNEIGSKILAKNFYTISRGQAYCQIPGGGTHLHPAKFKNKDINAYSQQCKFQMQGKEVYKLAANVLPDFCQQLLDSAEIEMSDIDWVVPHQASPSALKNMRKKLGIDAKKMIDIVSTHGNQISASILTSYHYLLKEKPIKRGDKILLIGTGAGLSVGGMIIEY